MKTTPIVGGERDSRAEFEAWARSVMPHCDISKLATNAEVYSNIVLEARWTTWQAARKAALEDAIRVVNRWALAGHISDKGISGEAMDAIRSLADRSPT